MRRVAASLGPLLLALLLVVLGACSEPRVRKRTFVGQASAPEEGYAVGLNPLGSLDTCLLTERARGQRNLVLISRPEYFTAEASRMISTLREALARKDNELPPVTFELSAEPLATTAQATAAGLRCGALIVLWEPGQTKTLQLTLPHPTQIPLRSLARSRLCEFGDHEEQMRVLYLTIAGLLAMREDDYDRAVLFLDSANRLDDHCLQLPGLPPAGPSRP